MFWVFMCLARFGNVFEMESVWLSFSVCECLSRSKRFRLKFFIFFYIYLVSCFMYVMRFGNGKYVIIIFLREIVSNVFPHEGR